MGASAVLGLAVLASYSALAAVALSAVGSGSVLSFPGWAVDAIIQVNAAPPAATPQYGSVTATPTQPSTGPAIVVTAPAAPAAPTVAVSTSKQGGTGSSKGGTGSSKGATGHAGDGGSGAGRGGASRGGGPGPGGGAPPRGGLPPQPARRRMCEQHLWRFHHRCIRPHQPTRRHQDH